MATEGKEQGSIPTHGRWILADSIESQPFGLLSVGEEYFAGKSVRSQVDSLGSGVLLPKVRKARSAGAPIDTVVKWGQGQVRVVVEPLFSPATKTFIGFLGIVTDPGAALPQKPKFGLLEWEVEKDSHRVESTWDAGMYDLYEVEQGSAQSPTGDMTQWLNTLVAPPRKDSFEGEIHNALNEHTAERHVVPYSINAGKDRSRKKQLQISGWVIQDSKDENRLWLRGISREAKPGTPIIKPIAIYPTAELFQKATALAGDRIFIRVNAKTWEIYYPQASWESFGLLDPADGTLESIVDADDFRALRVFIKSENPGPLRTRLRTHGGKREFELTWTPLDEDEEGSTFILCYLKPIDYSPTE